MAGQRLFITQLANINLIIENGTNLNYFFCQLLTVFGHMSGYYAAGIATMSYNNKL